MRKLSILQTGPLCTVQDRGRSGHAPIGVGRSGAADILAHDAANRLVGNSSQAATLEVTFGGLALRAEFDTVVAVTGASTECTVDGARQGLYSMITLPAGSILTLAAPTSGLRNYVAVRGGIDAPTVLGSRSTDTLSGIGPEVMRPGTELLVGAEHADWPAADFIPPPIPTPTLRLRIHYGPRDDWFTARARSTLVQQNWTVSQDSDRVGIRLDGAEPLPRAVAGELPSEGMVPGGLQVPPEAKPVLFLADHPVTGGYPVIAVVASGSIPQAAQLRPGDTVQFWVG